MSGARIGGPNEWGQVTVLVPNSKMVADIIHLDPSLQSIDPALIMAGIMQGHHSSTIASPVADSNSSPTSAPPTLWKK